MDLSLGLPIADPPVLLDWARRAERYGFAALGLLDRLSFDNPEPLVTLAMLAGATRTIRLQTEVLIAPLRQTALLAKQAATVDRLSAGRFTLGLGIGGRDDDHEAAGTPLTDRGSRFDRQLTDMKAIWAGRPFSADPAAGAGGVVGPRPATPAGPPLLIGGFAPAALRRVARHADGYLCAAPPAWAGHLLDQVRDEWAAAHRDGTPRLVCQINVALGLPATRQAARDAVAAYYAFTGRPDWGRPLTDAVDIVAAIDAYAQLGADEVVLYCHAPDPTQVDLLAELIQPLRRSASRSSDERRSSS